MRWKPRTPLGFGGLSVMLVLALVMPSAKDAWIREAAVIVLYFPLIVALGAGAVVTARMQRLCRFSGELSYPLYMTHYAVIWIWGDFAMKHQLANGGLAPPVIIGVVSMVAFAFVVLKVYDQPVRAYFSRKLLTNPSREASEKPLF